MAKQQYPIRMSVEKNPGRFDESKGNFIASLVTASRSAFSGSHQLEEGAI